MSVGYKKANGIFAELSTLCLIVSLISFFPLLLWITAENRTKSKKLFISTTKSGGTQHQRDWILDVWQGSEYTSGDTSKLEWSSKCVLLWKPSVFIILPIIRNQSKAKIIPHTVFETFINNNSRYKTQKISWWVVYVGDARNIHKSFFIKIVIGT